MFWINALIYRAPSPIFLIVVMVGCFFLIDFSSAAELKLEKISLPPIESKKIVLTIDAPGELRKYTIADIEILGLHRINTSTYWKEDDGIYEGVLLKNLLEDAGISGSTAVRITALDSYSAEIPKEDWEKWPIILATRKDGKVMSVREKGPTRIIYPKDLGGEVADTTMRVRWVWAIKQISPKQ